MVDRFVIVNSQTGYGPGSWVRPGRVVNNSMSDDCVGKVDVLELLGSHRSRCDILLEPEDIVLVVTHRWGYLKGFADNADSISVAEVLHQSTLAVS